jgi:hypothetical protein
VGYTFSAKGMSVDDFLGAGFMDSDAEDEVRLKIFVLLGHILFLREG